MRRTLSVLARLLASLLVLGLAAWTGLFLLYRMPGGPEAAWAASGAAGLAGLVALWAVAARRPLWALPLLLAFAGALGWFLAMTPHADRDWASDVSRPLTATIAGDAVTLHDLRDFDWTSETAFTPRWREETYRLSDLATLDVVNSYWTGPVIAHTLLSFGFTDGRVVTISVEIRREANEAYSSLAGFFRQYELVIVGATERDIVRLRSNTRGEDVALYRVRATPDQVRALFLAILARANALAARPEWYNSLAANCTTELFGAARTVAPGLSPDWRIVLSGYLPDYLYDHDLLDIRLPFRDLQAKARIRSRALAAGPDSDFSSAIRAGLPDPNR